MSSYLDQAGTQYLWGKVKTWVGNQGYLTSHQAVVDSDTTLSWGTRSKIGSVGSTDIHVTMPSNPNTDTKVTQTKTTVSGVKYLIFSNSTDTNTDGVSKDSRFYLNNSPSLIVQDDSNRQASLTPSVGIDINNGNSVGTRLQYDDVVMYGSGNTWDGSHSSLKNALAGKSNTGHTHSYLPLSGGTLTGNTFVKRASGESDLGATNTASGKNIYLYAADSGNVGLYSNIGTNLIYVDTNKKLTIGGTTYGFGNVANFRSALGLGTMATQNNAFKTWIQNDSWSAVGIATGSSSWKKVVGFTITTAGWYLCHICVTFPTNANGKIRQICLSAKGSTTNSMGYAFYDNRPPMGVGETKCHITCWAYFEANGTYNILAAHDAGSTLNVTPRMYAARFS